MKGRSMKRIILVTSPQDQDCVQYCRVSMKAPHMMTKLLPNIFLFHFVKTSKDDHIWRFGGKALFFRLFLILSETVHCKDLRFFALRSVHQDFSFELSKTVFGQFSKKNHHKGCFRGPKVTRRGHSLYRCNGLQLVAAQTLSGHWLRWPSRYNVTIQNEQYATQHKHYLSYLNPYQHCKSCASTQQHTYQWDESTCNFLDLIVTSGNANVSQSFIQRYFF